MAEHNVEPHRVTKPIQLLAAWLVGLFIIDGLFLTTAKLIPQPDWLAPLLVVAAVANVPLFLICIFVLQTRFRPEMQEDAFYSTYIQAQLTTEKEVGVARSQLELAETKDKLASLEENYQGTLQSLNIEASQRKQLEQDYEILKQTSQAVGVPFLLCRLSRNNPSNRRAPMDNVNEIFPDGMHLRERLCRSLRRREATHNLYNGYVGPRLAVI